jgi:flagellar assembly factor FliW
MRPVHPAPSEAPCSPETESNALQTASARSAPRVLTSRRFGRLEVVPDHVVTFPGGLLGFEEFHTYLRVAPEALEPLTFLVACNDPEVAFPVFPATLCLPDYGPAFPPEALAAVEGGPGDPLEVLVILSLDAEIGTLHANLRGPLLINPTTRIGCQVVMHDATYSLRHLVGAT